MKDLIIIGAGPGGYELALAAAKNGLTVLLIEKDEVGGTCLQRGCIPTKAYYKTASLLKAIKGFSEFGIQGNFEFNFFENLERKERIVQKLTEGIKFNLKKAGGELIYGEASLVSPTSVQVDGEIFEGRYLVIATGSHPARLPFGDIHNADIISSTEILSEKTVPKKLVIIGAGVIGIEIASIFNQFGSEVEVIEAMDTILPQMDTEISKRLTAFLKMQGIKFHLSSHVDNITGKKVFFTSKDKEEIRSFDKLLISIGRLPNTDNLGLEKLGIEFDKKGIKVNSDFQTNIPNIYAVGDVTGKMMLAHSATYSGYHVLKHILNEKSGIDFSILPSCVFSFPEVASVGITEKEGKELNCRVDKFHYQANGKAQSSGEVEGFVKVVSVDNLIKGVHIIGANASDLIHEAVVLLNSNASLSDLSEMIYAHPTLSETLGHCMR